MVKQASEDCTQVYSLVEQYRYQSIAALLLILLFSLPSRCRAQLTDVTDVTSTPIPGVGHDYIGLLADTVDPANGAVSLRIPVTVPASRGFTTQFSFTYDSNGVHFIAGGSGGYPVWNVTPTYLS